MALVVKDRVRETSTSTGTTDVILNGAVQAFQDFTVIGDGNTTYYAIVDATTGDWEVGIGTYTLATTTLTRNTILESSNGGSAVNFTANVKDVFVTYPAERAVYGNASNVVTGYTITGGSINNTPIGALTPTTGAFTDLAGSNVSLTGGAINGTTVGASTPSTGAFTTLTSTSTTTLNGTTIPASKTLVDTDSSQTLTNKAYNGSIGATTASTGAFTTLTSTSTTTLNGTTIPASKTLVDTDSSQTLTNKAYNGSIGATTASTGAFTDFSASGTASFTSTGAVKIPVGTTAQRPAGVDGFLRFNDDTNEFEGFNGTSWASVGGSAISNDTSTATDLYPTFTAATTGTALNIYTSNAKLLYKPSTGELKSEVLVAQNGIVVNSATIDTSYTIPAGSNAVSAGPVTIDPAATVTVSPGSVWVIV